jgi:hypothetical protein
VEQWHTELRAGAPLWRWMPTGAAIGRCRDAPTFAGGKRLQPGGRPCGIRGASSRDCCSAATSSRCALHSSGLSSSFETLILIDGRCSSSASHSGFARLWTPALSPRPLPSGLRCGDDIKPLATHVEGEGRWNRCCRVEANPAPPSPWRSQRVREIERPLRRLRSDTGPHDGLFGRRTHAATYAGKATVAAKAVEPLRTTYATCAERTRASPLCCHARAVSVGARPWVMDVR